jgi:hypothetical protein
MLLFHLSALLLLQLLEPHLHHPRLLNDVLALLVLLRGLKRHLLHVVQPLLSATGLLHGYSKAVGGRAPTYFQPRLLLHTLQKMSATVCRPVISMRSSLGPRLTFTLR